MLTAINMYKFQRNFLYILPTQLYCLVTTWYVRTLLTWGHVEGRSHIYSSRQCVAHSGRTVLDNGFLWLAISVMQNAHYLVRGDIFITRILKAGTKI